MRCPLADVEISVSDLMKLKSGDVVPLELPGLVTASIEEIPIFRGRYGVSKNKLAMKIEQRVYSELPPSVNGL